MKNLTFKIVSGMKKQRESSSSQIGPIEKANLVACYAGIGFNYVDMTMFAETNANLISHGFTPSPRTIEAETQQWYDIIEAQDNVYGGKMHVLDRCVFCAAGDSNGTIAGFPIETTTPIGTAASAASDGESTWCGRYYRYLTSNVGTSRLKTGQVQMPFPEITTRLVNGTGFASLSGATTFVLECHKIATALYASVGQTCYFMSNPNFSEVSSGFWGGVYTDSGYVCYDYYGGWNGISSVDAFGYAADLTKIWNGQSLSGYGIGTTHIPQVWAESGDLSGSISIPGRHSGDNFVSGTTQEVQWTRWFIDHCKNVKTLTNAGILAGYSWWGGWEGQNTSILYKVGTGESSQYFPNWRGQILQQFFRNDGMVRTPVITGGGTYTEANPSFGGRDRYF